MLRAQVTFPSPTVGFTLLWVVEHVAKLFVASTV